MKTQLTLIISGMLFLALAGSSLAGSPWVRDDFDDGVVDMSKWIESGWDSRSSIEEADGHMTFTSRGQITTVRSFPQVIVQGVFEISGHNGDVFSIGTRRDGSSPFRGVACVIGSSDNLGWGAYGGNAYIVTYDESGHREEPVRTWVDVPMDTPTLFMVVDDGSEVSLYINDMETPVLVASVDIDTGDQVMLTNRELGPAFVTKLDWVDIRAGSFRHIPGRFLNRHASNLDRWTPGRIVPLLGMYIAPVPGIGER